MGGPARLFFSNEPEGDEVPRLGDTSRSKRSELDPTVLAAWVRARPPLGATDTPYVGIRARVEESAPSSWQAAPRSPNELPAYLLRAIETAVERALTGVKRVAVLTGGGLDSAVLLAVAVRWAARTGGAAFAVATDYASAGDDRPHLRALEAHLGCEVVRVSPERAAPSIRWFRTGVDAAPFVWATGPTEIDLLERAKAHGAERALSGAGGDELFGGDPRALANLVLRGRPLRAIRAARALRGFQEPRSRVLSWVMRPTLARAVPRTLRRWRARRGSISVPDWAGPVLRSYTTRYARHQVDWAFRERWTPSDDLYRVYLTWNRHLQEVASGLDCWDPYLDASLQRVIEALPAELLLVGDCWRGLLREATRGLLPESLRVRMDKATAEESLVRFVDAVGGLATLRPLATVNHLADLGLAEPAPFQEAFARFEANPADGPSWVSLWPALAVESFLRELDQ